MNDQPLQPFAPPTALLDHFHISYSAGLLVEWVLYAIFAFWAVYTVIAIYHWLRYSHTSFLAFPAIGIHLYISFALMSYALTGNPLLLPFLP